MGVFSRLLLSWGKAQASDPWSLGCCLQPCEPWQTACHGISGLDRCFRGSFLPSLFISWMGMSREWWLAHGHISIDKSSLKPKGVHSGTACPPNFMETPRLPALLVSHWVSWEQLFSGTVTGLAQLPVGLAFLFVTFW